jgi:hypothetical protein
MGNNRDQNTLVGTQRVATLIRK